MRKNIESAALPAGLHFVLFKQKSNRLFPVTILLAIILVLGSCKTGGGDNSSVAKQLAPSNDSLVVIDDSVRAQNDASRLKIDELITRNTRLDSEIFEKDAAIARLKQEVNHLKKGNKSLLAEIKKDKKMIASFEEELNEKVRSFGEKIGLLQSDRDKLAAERDALQKKYNGLKDIASVLHASNIRLAALHVKHNGKEKKTRRARKADVLRIYFDIDENRIAEDGTKSLYLSIKDPEGHLLKDAQGSGVFSVANGAPVSYSLEKEIPLKQDVPVKDIVVDWKQEGDYEKGVYRIAIYNGGYKIGGGDVTLN